MCDFGKKTTIETATGDGRLFFLVFLFAFSRIVIFLYAFLFGNINIWLLKLYYLMNNIFDRFLMHAAAFTMCTSFLFSIFILLFLLVVVGIRFFFLYFRRCNKYLRQTYEINWKCNLCAVQLDWKNTRISTICRIFVESLVNYVRQPSIGRWIRYFRMKYAQQMLLVQSWKKIF